MKIQVTEDDIKRGVRYSCSLCPLARAIRRATGKRWVMVDGNAGLIISDENSALKVLETPLPAECWRCDFDEGKEVKPFEFELDYTVPKTMQSGLFT